MQTFTVKVTGNNVSARAIKVAIWQCTDLSEEDIIVTEN